MTKRDLIKAERMLKPYADRMERSGVEGGGWCLTVYWAGHEGGQKIFYALSQAEDRVAEIERRQGAESAPTTYLLRDIPADLWAKAKHRAVDESISLRELTLRALGTYLKLE